MSIFTVEQCWFTRLSQYHIFNPTCLVVANLLNEEKHENHQVIIGDESGKIIIILPLNRKKSNVDANSKDALDEHLLAHDTHLAILDLKVGRFNTSDPKKNSLAVVHTNKISIYSLVNLSIVFDTTTTDTVNTSTANAEEKSFYSEQISPIADIYELTLCYELMFTQDIFRAHVSFVACELNMLDSLIVQSMDCRVHVCLGSTILGIKNLSHHLIPGPMAVTDSQRVLVTFSTTMHIEGYKMHELMCENPMMPRDTIFPSWTISVNEPIFNVGVTCPQCLNSDQTSALFVAIGRHGVYVISEHGQLISSRQLDLTPCQLLVYGLRENQREIKNEAGNTVFVPWEPKFILTTIEKHLLVFQGTHIVWSAQLPWHTLAIAMPIQWIHNPNQPPPNIGVNFPAGLISVLDSEGIVRLTYLGTNTFTNAPKFHDVHTKSDGDVNQTAAQEPSQGLNFKQMEDELEELNKQIRTRAHDVSADFPLARGIDHRLPKVNLQVKLREQMDESLEGECVSHFIDVYMSFSNYSSIDDLDPVYLVANSCAPIRIVPNYMNFPRSQPENTDLVVAKEMVFKRFCSLAVEVDQSHVLVFRPPLDLTVRLVLGYSKPHENSGALQIARFAETCVKLPLDWFFYMKPAKKTQVTGLYRLTFDLAPELVAHEMRLHAVLQKLWPPNDRGSAVYISIKATQNPEPQNDADKEPHKVYLLENLKKGQVRIQGNYPEFFEPVLNELLSELERFRTENGFNVSRETLLSLKPTKFKESQSSPGQMTSEPSAVVHTMGPLCDYMFECLCTHLESRLALATQVAANAIQARHFRAVQSHVFIRIQDQVPVALNGFDTLLEASLHTLIQGCQSATEKAEAQIISGASVIAMISLLQLLCRKCIPQKNNPTTPSNHYVDMNLLNPSRLLAIVEANESVEVTRGTDTLPESEDVTGSDSASYVGLEEYLDLTLGLILSQITGQEPVGIKQYSTAVIPDINRLMQQLLSVLTIMSECEDSKNKST